MTEIKSESFILNFMSISFSGLNACFM